MTFTTETDENGVFLLQNLPSGRYSVTVTMPGFQTYKYTNINVRSMSLLEMQISLSIANVSAAVEVTSGASDQTVNTSNASVSNVKSSSVKGRMAVPPEQNSTPRLREYFPETLLWNPELITDKKGRAELKFNLADNITTWKLYTIASTKNGKIGVAEKEITAFQPFFVDLEPPKFLTNGDEISLPVQVRNYTEKKQNVGVTMTKANWFSFLGQEKQQVDVGSGDSKNAVFGFKAIDVIKDGKQRVTALAQGESDAIEKPVTVRPDGEEIVKTETNIFSGMTAFDVNFPATALPKTQRAEIKIYPNLFSHVTESVEGLLQRPYGCGEQTISSTYPNLMILKFIKNDGKLVQKAQKYLKKGYERLIGYQVEGGGFSYWGGKDTPDVALTAYALRFLNDAKEFIEVDETIVANARDWLIKQQRTDGSWTKKYYYETSEAGPHQAIHVICGEDACQNEGKGRKSAAKGTYLSKSEKCRNSRTVRARSLRPGAIGIRQRGGGGRDRREAQKNADRRGKLCLLEARNQHAVLRLGHGRPPGNDCTCGAAPYKARGSG